MKRSFRKGFTLIELLIVVIIIGILATIALPRLMGMKDRSYETVQNADLKNLVTAQEMFFADSSAYKGGTTADTLNTGGLAFTPSPNITAGVDISQAEYGNGRTGFGAKAIHGQREATTGTARCVVVTQAAAGVQRDCDASTGTEATVPVTGG